MEEGERLGGTAMANGLEGRWVANGGGGCERWGWVRQEGCRTGGGGGGGGEREGERLGGGEGGERLGGEEGQTVGGMGGGGTFGLGGGGGPRGGDLSGRGVRMVKG